MQTISGSSASTTVRPDCTIIVLSYNNYDVIGTCLEKAETAAKKAEKAYGNKVVITVVDNASTDKSVEMIKKRFREIELIELEENLGASGGNNVAMKQARTPYMLLINSDTYLQEDSLVRVFGYIKSHPECDALCVRLKFGDGSFQAFGGFLPNPMRTITWAMGIESLPIIKNLIKPFYQYSQSFYEKEQTMEWCATSFIFIRKEVYEKTRGMDEKIFIHMEDVEWCKRINDAGYKLNYTPDVEVIHLGGKSTGKYSAEKLLSQHINGLKYYHLKHHHRTWPMVRTCLLLGMKLRKYYYLMTGNKIKTQAYSAIEKLLFRDNQ